MNAVPARSSVPWDRPRHSKGSQAFGMTAASCSVKCFVCAAHSHLLLFRLNHNLNSANQQAFKKSAPYARGKQCFQTEYQIRPTFRKRGP